MKAEIVTLGGKYDGEANALGPWTFENPEVRGIVESHLSGRVLNACAGKTRLDHDAEIVRNDLNPDRDADTRVDVREATASFDEESFGTVVYDPPFDVEQAAEHYDGYHVSGGWQARKELAALVEAGGVMIELGWNTYSIGEHREYPGWTREETHLIKRSPVHRPVFLTADRRKA